MEVVTKCPDCGNETTQEIIDILDANEVPYRCPTCKGIKLDLQPIRDVVFIFPAKKTESVSGFILPDEKFIGGNTRDKFSDPVGIILAVGKGYFCPTQKSFLSLPEQIKPGQLWYYNRNVPWKITSDDFTWVTKAIVYCGFLDLYFQK